MEECYREADQILLQRTLLYRNKLFTEIMEKINRKRICRIVVKGILAKRNEAHLLCLHSRKDLPMKQLKRFTRAWISHLELPYRIEFEKNEPYLEVMIRW